MISDTKEAITTTLKVISATTRVNLATNQMILSSEEVAEITFKVAVITYSVVNITFEILNNISRIYYFLISEMHVQDKKYVNFVFIFRLTGKSATQKLKSMDMFTSNDHIKKPK